MGRNSRASTGAHHVEEATAVSDDLSGVWDGTYIQPGTGMVTFTATLVEAGGAIEGHVTEPCSNPRCPLRTHSASITGHRAGSVVSFVKRYEPPGYGFDIVQYDGIMNGEATEIDGRWRLPGTSGSFLMIRASKRAQANITGTRADEPARE
ncbi:hypothetical protein ABIC09_000840 [Bradyrhizobium sp. S3.12.5]|uniref:hypothetical protein n=1 Tax=Bradyrhizobium sp. S3.12.5 TaxID=3156386 RepID=UPI003394172F